MQIKPNEICFLNYINGLDHSNNLPSYWKYNYGINSDSVTKKLIDMGFLEFKLDIENNISGLTIPQLKEILRNQNLPLNGNKSNLISRIFENVDLTYLEENFPTKKYYLTNTGKELIENYYLFIINQKQNYNFKDEDILEIYEKYPDKDNQNKLIELFNYVIQKDLLKKDYNDLKLRISELYDFYLKIDLYNEALFYYIVGYKLKLFNFRTINSDIYLDDVSYIEFEDFYMYNLKNIINLTGISNTDLKNIIDTEEITSTLPFKYFSNDECYKILIDLLNGKKFNLYNYKINKPITNSKQYIYYGFNDKELFNNTMKKQSPVTKNSNNFINNILNNLFKK